MSWPWSVLGLEGPCETGAVKRAYAEKVKTAHPEEDPEGFQRLHTAYQAARRLAAGQGAPELTAVPAGFDYDALLSEEEAGEPGPLPPAEDGLPAEDWDYERLFAEGEEERRQAQQHRAGDRPAEDGEEKKGGRTRTPWHKRVFRRERTPLLVLWLLLSVLFAGYFLLSGGSPLKREGPEPGSVSVERREENAVPPASDSPRGEDETRQGIETARDLAVSLAGDDYPGPYAVTAAGIAENGDGSEQYYWAQCTGQDAGGETLIMNYFLTTDGTKVCCVSDEDNTAAARLEFAGTAPVEGGTVSVYRCPK